MSKVRIIEFVLISLIFLVAFSASLYLYLNTPLWSDSTKDGIIITHLAESGEISPVQPYLLNTPTSNVPILYPQLYSVLVATLMLFMGSVALNVVPALSVALLIVAIYILARYIGGYIAGLFAALASFAIFISTNSIESDIYVAFLTVLSMLTFFKAMQLKNKRWLFVTSILAGGAIGMKQLGWFAILFIVLAVIVYACLERKTFLRSLKVGLTVILLAVVLCFSVLWYHFSSTGCIVAPGFLPQPLDQVEAKVATVLGIERYEMDPAVREYHSGSRVVAGRWASATPEETIDFMNPFTQRGKEEFLEGFFLLLFTFGLIYTFRAKSLSLFILVLLALVLAVIYNTLEPIKTYFILLPIISSIVIAHGVVLVSNAGRALVRSSMAMTVIGALIATIFFSGAVMAAQTSYQYRLDMGVTSQPRQSEYQEMGWWIDRNLPQDAIVLASRSNELAQYSHRRVIWLTTQGGDVKLFEALQFGTEEELITAMTERKIHYVFIDKKWVGNPRSWPAYVSPEGVKKLEASSDFKNIFNTELLILYELTAK